DGGHLPVAERIPHAARMTLESGQRQHEAGVEDVRPIGECPALVQGSILEQADAGCADAVFSSRQRDVAPRARQGVRRLKLRAAAERAEELGWKRVIHRLAAVIEEGDACVSKRGVRPQGGARRRAAAGADEIEAIGYAVSVVIARWDLVHIVRMEQIETLAA